MKSETDKLTGTQHWAIYHIITVVLYHWNRPQGDLRRSQTTIWASGKQPETTTTTTTNHAPAWQKIHRKSLRVGARRDDNK